MRATSFASLLAAAVVPVCADAGYPPPPPGWRSRFVHAGAYSGFSLESTPFFMHGRWFMMESQLGNFAPDGRAHSHFAIKDFDTGEVVAAPPESSGFSFFSAIVDASRQVLWVFGCALDRFNATVPAPCPWGHHLKDNSTTCYIQSFSTSDFVSWNTSRALTVPAWEDPLLIIANVAVSFVPATLPGARALPPHQAFMALEADPTGGFAINTGTDGDLSSGWVMLNRSAFALAPLRAYQCPFTRHDGSHYYVVGMSPGGTAVFVSRSASLAAGTWESSSLNPISQGCAWGWEPCSDGLVAPGVYTHFWGNGTANSSLPFLANMTSWMWSTSDIDAADDGAATTRYIWSGNAQSAPANYSGRSSIFSGLGLVLNATVAQWLASYF